MPESPQFDVEAARKSGASDDQILSYLAQRSPNFDVQGALGKASKADVVNYLAAHAQGPPQGAQATSTIKAGPKEWSIPWLKEKLYNIADSLTEALPAAGATAGAMIGGGTGSGVAPGPGTVAGATGGAGIGGMAGEALKQHVRRALGFEVPQTSEDAAREITKQGIIQGGIEAVTGGMAAGAKPLQRAAETQYTRALYPTTARNKAIAEKITPGMMDRGVHGSLQGMADQAGAEAGAVRPQLDAAYTALGAQKPTIGGAGDTVVNALESMKGKYVVQGQVANPTAVKAISDVQDIVKQYGSDISPDSLRKLKQIFDDPVAAKGGYAGADLSLQYGAKAQKAAANSIRDILHSNSADVAALDKEISFWLDVQRVTSASALRQTGQQGGLLRTVVAPMGASAGVGLGISGHEAAGIGTAVVSAVGVAMRTPQWRTASALFKNSLGDALAAGNAGRATALLGRLGVAVQAGQESSARTANQAQQ